MSSPLSEATRFEREGGNTIDKKNSRVKFHKNKIVIKYL